MLTLAHIFFFGTLSVLVMLALLQWEENASLRKRERAKRTLEYLKDVITPDDREAL